MWSVPAGHYMEDGPTPMGSKQLKNEEKSFHPPRLSGWDSLTGQNLFYLQGVGDKTLLI